MTTPTHERVSNTSFTAACIVAYGMLGYTMSGMGAVLPDLRDALGGIASIYPSLPGAALIVLASWHLARPDPGHETSAGRRRFTLVLASVALAGSIGLVVWTAVTLVSALGAVAFGVAAAVLIRLLPAALTAEHLDDPAPVMTRANAWSSLASIAGPLAIGAVVAVGLGWRFGYVVAPVVGAAVVTVLVARRAGRATARVEGAAVTPEANRHRPASRRTGQPWADAWLLLTLSILIEFAFAVFAATYLKEEVGLSSAVSAAGAAAFAIGMTVGRFLAGPVRAVAEAPFLTFVVVITGGFALMWFIPEAVTAIAGLAVAGFGVSLLYPRGIDRLMRRFPESVDHGATLGALASGTALLGAPALLGALRAIADVRAAYLAVPVLIVALVGAHAWCEHRVPLRAD